jgi:hypothetical protein
MAKIAGYGLTFIPGGGGGSDPTFTTLSTGQVPKANASGKLIYGDATVDPTSLEWTFDETINVPSGSLNIGEVLQLSEGTADLVIVDLLDNQMAFATVSNFDDSVGAAPPFYIDYGAPQTLTLQPVDTTVITTNPLDFSFTGTVVAPDIRLVDQVTIRANGAMTNFRARITDNATGLVVRYIPSKSVFDSGTGGLTLIAGDNTFFLASNAADTPGNFNLGFQPFVIESGQVIDFRLEADSIDLLGNAINVPFVQVEAHDGPPTGVGGNVRTEETLTDNFMVRGNSGIEIDLTPHITAPDNQLVMQATADLTNVAFIIRDELSVDQFSIVMDGTSLDSVISATGNLDINANSINANLTLDADLDINLNPGQLVDITTLTNEGVRSLIIERTGTQNAQVGFFVADRDPITGSVLGSPGNVSYEANGTSSEIWVHRGAGADTTSWVGVFASIAAADTLAEVLSNGNTTGGTDIVITDGDAITSTSASEVLDITSTATIDNSIFVQADSLTSGGIAVFASNSADATARNLISITQSNASATGSTNLLLSQAANRIALNIAASGVTTVSAVSMVANNLTTGSVLNVASTSANTSFRSTAVITSANGTSASALTVNNSFIDGAAKAIDIIGRVVHTSNSLTTNAYRLVANTNTTGTAMSIAANALTSASALSVASASPSTVNRDVFSVANSNVLGTGAGCIFSSQNANHYNLRLENNGVTTANSVEIVSNNLTTGIGLRVNSNSASTAVGNIAFFLNDNVLAVNRTVLTLQQNSTGLALDAQGDVNIAGKLTVSGLIDPTGLVLDEQATVPGGAPSAGTGTIWTRNDTPNVLVFTDDTGADTVLGSAVGDVAGPASSITNSIALFGDGTGKLLDDASIVTYTTSGNNRFLDFNHDVLNTGFVELRWFNSVASEVANILYRYDTNAWILQNFVGDIEFTGQTGLSFSQNSTSGTIDFTSGGNEDQPAISISRTGTQPGSTSIFVSDRTPIGNVSAAPGTLAVIEDESTSKLLIHKGAGANNTDWFQFITGPNSAITQNTIPYFDNTAADSLAGDSILTYITSGNDRFLNFNHNVTNAGNVGFNWISNTASTEATLTHDFNINETTLSSPFSTLLLTALEVDLTSTFGGDISLVSSAHIDFTSSGAESQHLLAYARTGSQPGASRLFISDRTPIGNVTGNPGDESIREDAAQSAKYLHKGVSANNTDWYTFSINPPELIEIHSTAELEALATAGVITVATGENLSLDIKTASISSTTRFVLEGTAELRISSILADPQYLYTGTGAFISGTGSRVSMVNIVLVSISTGTFVSLSNSTLNIFGCLIVGFDDLGSLSSLISAKNLIIRNTTIVDCDSGFDITNVNLAINNVQLVLAGITGNFINVLSNVLEVAIAIDQIVGDIGGSNAVLRITPDLKNNSSALVFNSPINDILFDVSGGSTGTFTAVADAPVASTTINSVTDSSGIARFNFTVGPTLFVNQEVVIVGYTTNTAYNTTGNITATGAGFFEIEVIPFGTNEAGGSFTSDSVTLTDTATTLVDGDTLVIRTDLSTDYDNGATVYNQLTNTFQINRTFTVTQTGTWDTAGIDETDPRVLAFNNSNFKDSQFIASAFVTGNTDATTIAVSNTFVDIIFGTVGSAIVSGETIERWKVVDEINCILEYVGREPTQEGISNDITAISSGGTLVFPFKWEIDRGAGFVDLDDNIPMPLTIGADASSISGRFRFAATLGDQIKPQVTRESGSSTITVQRFVVN